jgi:hypothetical protein
MSGKLLHQSGFRSDAVTAGSSPAKELVKKFGISAQDSLTPNFGWRGSRPNKQQEKATQSVLEQARRTATRPLLDAETARLRDQLRAPMVLDMAG